MTSTAGSSFQILSDLHLEIERVGAAPGQEFYHYDIQPCAPNLVLLGDIGWTVQDELFQWIEQQRSTLAQSIGRLEAFAAQHSQSSSTHGRFILLNRSRYDVSPTLTLLGCTLWTRLDPEELDILSWSLTDFRRIEGWNPTAVSTEHENDLGWLNRTVAEIAAHEPHRAVAIVTHHAPTVEGTSPPQFSAASGGLLTKSAFATELSEEPSWNSEVVRLWAFGHTHFSCDFVHKGIRVYANQRGYKDGEGAYDSAKIVVL